MATIDSEKEQAVEKVTQIMDGEWGLMTCAEHKHCAFCAVYGKDPDRIKSFRDHYITGLELGIIFHLVDEETPLTREQFHTHAYQQSWHIKRKKVAQVQLTPGIITNMVLARYMKAKDTISEQTGDKMIEAAMKLAGIGQKVEVQKNVTYTWETTVSKVGAQKEGDAIITLEDEDFSEIETPLLEEREHAEAD